MKQKDIALIIVIVFVSGVASFIISNNFISPPEHTEEAAVVEPITTEFDEPSERYFNAESINPTQMIQIQEGQNPDPFQ
jgi:hypothetical protein